MVTKIMSFKEAVGMKIKFARFQKGLKSFELANKANLSATHLSRIEKGKSSPTIETLRAIGKALGIPPSYFLKDIKYK